MSSASTLAEKVVELHSLLTDAELGHAFGGALALAYCTAEPRATRDIDVNVFLSPDRVDQLLDALPADIVVTERSQRELKRDGQSRLWWDGTPVDIFLSNHSFHDQVESNRRVVPFADVEALPVLACADLAVFKGFFARPKDAIDIAAMVAAGAVDVERLERDMTTLLGNAEERDGFFALVHSAIEHAEGETWQSP